MPDSLRGKVAIVTGGGRGIGRAIAEAYAREGAAVVVCSRNRDEVDSTAAFLRDRGGRAEVVAGDVGDPATAERLIDTAQRKLGGCDILVNAAAISGPVGEVETLEPAAWSETFRINVTGTFLACRAVVPVMKRNGGGRIINVSSGLAERVQPGQAAYSASKAAVVQFSRVLAEEVRDTSIRVNAVHPGIVRTAMVDKLLALPAAGVHSAMVERLRSLDAAGKIVAPETSARFFVWVASECEESGGFLQFDDFLRASADA